MNSIRDKLKIRGRVEIIVSKGNPQIIPGKVLPRTKVTDRHNKLTNKPIYDKIDIHVDPSKLISREVLENIVVNKGKDIVIEGLTSGTIDLIARMSIGDRGTIPSDSTVPKVPTSGLDVLFNEVFRADIDFFSLNTGGSVHEVQFVRTFTALDISITAFSNQANPVVNEVGLITADVITGAALPRPPVESPNAPDADEQLFALRTFKSVPFEAANEISVTIRYTIFLE